MSERLEENQDRGSDHNEMNDQGTGRWDHFMSTGSVGDYLEFKQSERKGAHAGMGEREGNHFKDGAYRGL